MAPLLGWIPPQDRTPAMQRANDEAMAFVTPVARHTLPIPKLEAGQSIRLWDLWGKPEVVKDAGVKFTRIFQQTGSCVWAGGTVALMSTIAAQRCGGAQKTKAFVPFTLQNYAYGRHLMGDDGQGEGCMGAGFARALVEKGVTEWKNDGTLGMPRFQYGEKSGIQISRSDELKWSSIRNPQYKPVVEESDDHLLGAATEARDVAGIRALISNGYGVSFACLNYIGNARIQGSGDNACVIGKWNTYGPHQQSIHAVWEHPQFGPLYWSQNNWPEGTYPDDPAGGPECGCWVKEDDVADAMRKQGEVFGFSNLNWFPAAPELIDWFI
jgi:hypothetical protein